MPRSSAPPAWPSRNKSGCWPASPGTLKRRASDSCASRPVSTGRRDTASPRCTRPPDVSPAATTAPVAGTDRPGHGHAALDLPPAGSITPLSLVSAPALLRAPPRPIPNRSRNQTALNITGSGPLSNPFPQLDTPCAIHELPIATIPAGGLPHLIFPHRRGHEPLCHTPAAICRAAAQEILFARYSQSAWHAVQRASGPSIRAAPPGTEIV